MLKAQNRQHYRPAHLHVMIVKPGYKTMISQVYVKDDELIGKDPQFGVTTRLLGDYKRHDEAAPKAGIQSPWYQLDYEFIMETGESTLPRPPIK